MNGKETTLKLLNVSRMAAHEIALHLKDKNAARRGDLLSPSLSKQGECLVWIYRQFLTSTIIPFPSDSEINAIFEKNGATWEGLFAVLSSALPDETYRNLVKAWRSANDALGAILRREGKPPRSEALYAELDHELEQSAKKFSDGGQLESVIKKLDSMECNAKIRHEKTLSAVDEINKNLANNTLNFDWKKCKSHPPRFLCDKDFKSIKDEKHTGHPDCPKIETYLNLPEKARIAIKELLAAAKGSPDKWWTKSVFKDKAFKGQSYSEAFGPALDIPHRFKKDQIEVGTNKRHKGEWRILPDQDFLERYRKNYPPEDALSGS